MSQPDIVAQSRKASFAVSPASVPRTKGPLFTTFTAFSRKPVYLLRNQRRIIGGINSSTMAFPLSSTHTGSTFSRTHFASPPARLSR